MSLIPKDEKNLTSQEFSAAIETILFAAGDPVSAEKLADILEISRETISLAMDELMDDYARSTSRGIYIRRINSSYTLSTKPEMKEIIQNMFTPKNRPAMSQAAYETLAIVAYNQPVTRAQIEAVRGVSSDGIIARLAEKDLIRECGTLDAPGRPMLFETTEVFLKEFGLSSIHDLAPMDMLMYKTLRQIEESAAEGMMKRQDSQMTIQQLLEASEPPENTSIQEIDSSIDEDPIDAKDVIDISEALFRHD